MLYSCRCTWRSWLTLTLLLPVHAFLLYRAVVRYLLLKTEVTKGHLVKYPSHSWVQTVQTVQLFSLVAAGGLLPLWVGLAVLSPWSRRGYARLVWWEVTRLHQLQTVVGKVRAVMLLPLAGILQLALAAALLVPVPFVEAWTVHLGESDRKRPNAWSSPFDSLLDRSNLQVTVTQWSPELINLGVALLQLCLQLSSLFWPLHRLFSAAFSFMQILLAISVFLDSCVISVFIRTYFTVHIQPNDDSKTPIPELPSIFLQPVFIISVAVVGNMCLLGVGFANFQFAHIRLVQTLCNRRLKTQVRTNVYPALAATLLFVVSVAAAIIRYYHNHRVHLSLSGVFYIYLLFSGVLLVICPLYWLILCLQPQWDFRTPVMENDAWPVEPSGMLPLDLVVPQYNSFRSLRFQSEPGLMPTRLAASTCSGGADSGQHSLSFSSNGTGQTLLLGPYDHSAARAGSERSLNYSSHLKSPSLSATDHYSYHQSNSVPLNQSRMYKSLYACSSPRPNSTDFKGPNTFNHINVATYGGAIEPGPKYEYTYSNGRPAPPVTQTIQEEAMGNENDSLLTDYAASSPAATPKYDQSSTKTPGSAGNKFVTFQLDKATVDYYGTTNSRSHSDASDDNLTLVSMEPTETFLRELDNGSGQDRVEVQQAGLNKTSLSILSSLTQGSQV